jgi:hypothetical protein
MTMLERMVKRLINQEDWSRWYTKGYDVGPERCFLELLPSIPDHVKNVIDFGCAAGRNLVPFDGRYRLYGVDIIEEKKMEWRIPFKDLTYIQSRLEDFEFAGPMNDFLCISHGALMYTTPAHQRRLLAHLVDRGCRNFIMQEYDEYTGQKEGYHAPTLLNQLLRRRIGYPYSNPFDFDKRWFRSAIPAWIRLDGKAV